MNSWAAFGLGVAFAWLPCVFAFGLMWIIDCNTVREGHESARKQLAAQNAAADRIVYYDATAGDRELFQALTR